LGISQSALCQYETDERMPRDEIKVRLSNYYGVSVQALFYTQESHVSWFLQSRGCVGRWEKIVKKNNKNAAPYQEAATH